MFLKDVKISLVFSIIQDIVAGYLTISIKILKMQLEATFFHFIYVILDAANFILRIYNWKMLTLVQKYTFAIIFVSELFVIEKQTLKTT